MNHKLTALLVTMCVLLCSCVRQTVATDEKQIFVPVSAMVDYGMSIPDGYAEYEKYAKKMYYDSTFELEYEYNPPDNISSDVRYLSESYSFENKSSDVLINEFIQRGVSGAIFQARGIKLVEKPDIFSFGSRSKLYDITGENQLVVGNYFVATYDKITFTFIVVGMHIAQKEIWTEMLEARLNKSKGFRIGFYSLNSK